MNFFDGQGFPVSLQGLMEDISEYINIYMDFDELIDPLWEAVGKLSPEDRHLVNLIYLYEGVKRSDKEIASFIGISEAPLKRERQRILRKLSSYLFCLTRTNH